MAELLRTNGTRETISPEAAERMKDWKQVSESIGGGYIERVCPRISPDVVMLVDEEGLLKGLRENAQAGALYGGLIVGDAVVMTRAEAREWGWL